MLLSWLKRALSTERALCLVDLERMSGWSARTIRKGLSELIAQGDAVRFCDEDYDHGTLPAVFMATRDIHQMLVGLHVLKQRAQPKMDAEAQETKRRRNEYIAGLIRRRKEREEREWREAEQARRAKVG